MDTPNTNFITKLHNFFSTSSYSRTLSILALLIVAAAVPLTLANLGQQQDIRQRASESVSQYNTPNGPLTVAAMKQQMKGAGWAANVVDGWGNYETFRYYLANTAISNRIQCAMNGGADLNQGLKTTGTVGNPVQASVAQVPALAGNSDCYYPTIDVNITGPTNYSCKVDSRVGITNGSVDAVSRTSTCSFTPTQPGTYTAGVYYGGHGAGSGGGNLGNLPGGQSCQDAEARANCTIVVNASKTPDATAGGTADAGHCANNNYTRMITSSRESSVRCSEWESGKDNLCASVDNLNAHFYKTCTAGTAGAEIVSILPLNPGINDPITITFKPKGDTNYVNLWVGSVGSTTGAKDDWGGVVVQAGNDRDRGDNSPTTQGLQDSLVLLPTHPSRQGKSGTQVIGILPYYSFRKDTTGEFDSSTKGQPVSQTITIGNGGGGGNNVNGQCGSGPNGEATFCTYEGSFSGTTAYVRYAQHDNLCPSGSRNNQCYYLQGAAAPAAPAAGGTSLSLNLKLGAIGGTGENADPKTKTKDVRVCIYALTADPTNDATACTNAALTKTGTLSFGTNGRYSSATFDIGSTLPTGQYQVFVKSGKYLRKRVAGTPTITAGAVNQIPQTSLIQGDINNDNSVDIRDYNALLACFDKNADTEACKAADVDDSGKVDGVDYKFFIESLSVKEGD